MSASTVPSSSDGQRSTSQSLTRQMHSDMNVYDMPPSIYRDLCIVLDSQDLWANVAYQMGYTKKDIDEIKYEGKDSPAAKLLSSWGDQNHTVSELFMLLNSMQQYPAMDCLRPIVDPVYHRLIFSGQPDISGLLANKSGSGKILNGPPNLLNSSDNNDSADLMDTSEDTSYILDPNNINKLASSLPLIPYSELEIATNNWHGSNQLGRGGFGTVFRGKWKFTDVAIKRIEYRGSRSDLKNAMKIEMQQILNELRHLNSCRHDNILPIYGYSYGGKEPCLVYQLMGGGSLENRLSDTRNPLTMEQRKIIAIGTARGLQFLHTFSSRPLIHGDIKPANILLDVCCMPKIGDFGLAREGSIDSMEVSKAYGTRPFLPTEFLKDRILSTKVDTYSFGVMLFVLMTGKRAYDKSRGSGNEYLAKHVAHTHPQSLSQLIDHSMNIKPEEELIYKKIITLGLYCTKELPAERPEMVQVMQFLES